MFKLPVCPHCHTVYRYKEVKKISNNKNNICYHCKKRFRVSRKKLIIFFFLLIVICVAVNVAQLYMTPSLNLLLLIGTDMIILLIAAVFAPFLTSFKKLKRRPRDK